jgi:hypothetical protein
MPRVCPLGRGASRDERVGVLAGSELAARRSRLAGRRVRSGN